MNSDRELRLEQQHKKWRRFDDLYFKSKTLTDTEILELEQKVVSESELLEHNTRLFGYYCFLSEVEGPNYDRGVELALWFIKNHPDALMLVWGALPFVGWRHINSKYLEVEELWIQHLSHQPNDPNIFWNAHIFFELDPRREEKILETLTSLDPHYFRYLFKTKVHNLAWESQPQESARKLLDEFQAHENDLSDRAEIIMELIKCAHIARDEELAREQCVKLLSQQLGEREKYFHLQALNFLGLSSLMSGDKSSALQSFEKTIELTRTLSINNFDHLPLELAQELLNKGEIERVCSLFEACDDFFTVDRRTRDELIEDIQAGITKDICFKGFETFIDCQKIRSLKRMGRPDRAQFYLDRMPSEKDPNGFDSLGLSLIAMAEENLPLAIKHFVDAVQRNHAILNFVDDPSFQKITEEVRRQLV